MNLVVHDHENSAIRFTVSQHSHFLAALFEELQALSTNNQPFGTVQQYL